MKCTKCGSDALIKTGDWYECTACGAKMFDTEITVNNVENPTKLIEKIDKDKPSSDDVVTYNPEEPVKKAAKKSKEDEPEKTKANSAK